MKNHSKFVMVVVPSIMALFTGSVRAFVGFDLQADALELANGSPAPVSTLVLLVADTGGNGFGAPAPLQNTDVNSVFGDANDRIVGRFDLSINSIPGYFSANPGNIDFSSVTSWAAGQALGIYWLPSRSLLSTTVAANDPYGFFSGPALDGSDDWVTPADGNTSSLYLFTPDGSVQQGTSDAAKGRATSFITSSAPEPGKTILLFAGSVAMLCRRRR